VNNENVVHVIQGKKYADLLCIIYSKFCVQKFLKSVDF